MQKHTYYLFICFRPNTSNHFSTESSPRALKISTTFNVYSTFLLISASNTQFPPVNKKTKPNACDDANKTALVEHFFNVIFNEFHSTPPVCVCVQMCANTPTYCYPNGCLKKVDNKKKSSEESRPAPVTNIQNMDTINTMFLIDEKNDFAHYLNENVEGGKNGRFLDEIVYIFKAKDTG